MGVAAGVVVSDTVEQEDGVLVHDGDDRDCHVVA